MGNSIITEESKETPVSAFQPTSIIQGEYFNLVSHRSAHFINLVKFSLFEKGTIMDDTSFFFIEKDENDEWIDYICRRVEVVMKKDKNILGSIPSIICDLKSNKNLNLDRETLKTNRVILLNQVKESVLFDSFKFNSSKLKQDLESIEGGKDYINQAVKANKDRISVDSILFHCFNILNSKLKKGDLQIFITLIDFFNFKLHSIYESLFNRLVTPLIKSNKDKMINEELDSSPTIIISSNTVYVNLVNTINKISEVIAESILKYFRINQVFKTMILFDLLTHLIKDILVKEKLYKLIFSIKEIICASSYSLYKCNLILLSNITPYDLNINPYFSQDLDLKKFALGNLRNNSKEGNVKISKNGPSNYYYNVLPKTSLKDFLNNSEIVHRISAQLEFSSTHFDHAISRPAETNETQRKSEIISEKSKESDNPELSSESSNSKRKKSDFKNNSYISNSEELLDSKDESVLTEEEEEEMQIRTRKRSNQVVFVKSASSSFNGTKIQDSDLVNKKRSFFKRQENLVIKEQKKEMRPKRSALSDKHMRLEVAESRYSKLVGGDKMTKKTDRPYLKAILHIKENYNNLTLLSKLSLFEQSRTYIIEEVSSFWSFSENKKALQSLIDDRISFNADAAILLFTYMLIKVKINSLYIDLQLINDLSSEKIKISNQGCLLNLTLSSNEIINQFLDETNFAANQEQYNISHEKEKKIIKKLI